MNAPKGTGIALGIAMGVALGAALDNIALGIALGLVFGIIFDAQQSGQRNKAEGTHGDVRANENTINDARKAERDAAIARVLAEAKRKGSITNDDVQTLLGVSDATAERYLQDLETGGEMVQVGTTGTAVSYKPI